MGLVRLTDVGTEVGVVKGKRLLSVWKISARCLSSVTWRPGCCDSLPCSFLIACTKSSATRLVLYTGDSWGMQKC